MAFTREAGASLLGPQIRRIIALVGAACQVECDHLDPKNQGDGAFKHVQ